MFLLNLRDYFSKSISVSVGENLQRKTSLNNTQRWLSYWLAKIFSPGGLSTPSTPFHQLVPTPAAPSPTVNVESTKTRLVAWLVSNCHTPSHREEYVKDLRKYSRIVDEFFFHTQSGVDFTLWKKYEIL